jgi:hypothetical protein
LQCPLLDSRYVLARFSRIAIEEVFNQQGDVLFSFSKSRNFNRKYVEPEEQVAAKLAVRDGGLQVAVSRRNDPNISSDGGSSADTLKFVFLQNTQQSNLGFGREISNFVKEDRASVGQFEAS